MNYEDVMKEGRKFDLALQGAFARVNERLDQIEARLIEIEGRITSFDERISALEKH